MRSDEQIETTGQIAERLIAPVKVGTEVGTITYSVDGKVYLTESVVTKNGVENIEPDWCVEQILRRFLIL